MHPPPASSPEKALRYQIPTTSPALSFSRVFTNKQRFIIWVNYTSRPLYL
ncbi:hypothetical protein Hanom_Chr04g00362041 [Helianthus anomalus]